MEKKSIECRPIECNQCKKRIHISYSEVVDQTITTWKMCRDCPILQEKLQGKNKNVYISGEHKDLYCSHCHTSLESVFMGGPLGCKECYQTFRTVLIDQLADANQLPSRLAFDISRNASKLHVGRNPHITEDDLSATRMHDLSKALAEAIKEENYEEAAWLRDQINLLMEKVDGKS